MLRDELIHAVEQRAAAGEADAVLRDIARKLGGRFLEQGADGLEDLGKGRTITECINWLKESLGISYDEARSMLNDLCERCNEWEIANMSDIGRLTSENNGKH